MRKYAIYYDSVLGIFYHVAKHKIMYALCIKYPDVQNCIKFMITK